jgi:hypothetical protein
MYSSTPSLTSALDGVGGQRHVPAVLPAGKRSGTHCIGGWVGLRAGLDRCGKSRPHRHSIPGPNIKVLKISITYAKETENTRYKGRVRVRNMQACSRSRYVSLKTLEV